MRGGQGRRRAAVAALLLIACAAACATTSEGAPGNAGSGALEARHRVMQRLRGAPAPPLTAVYRGVVRVGSGSHCRMYPSDSQLHDIRARECGATAAAVLAIARLYLEVAAGPDLLPPVLAEGRLRWQHLPPAGSCAP